MTGRVLVTGASGFIGGRLASSLVTRGVEVHGVARPGREGELPPGVLPAIAELTDPAAVLALVRSVRPETVFHLAARVTGDRRLASAGSIVLDNLAQVVHLATALSDAGCGRLVLAGSMEEPGAGEPATAVPGSPYAASKWAATGFVRMAHALYGLPVVVARLFMVYGPGQKDTSKLVPHVITALLAGESPALSSGLREVDWIHVDDVVDGLLAIAEASGVEGESLDLGSGRLVTIRRIVERIAERIASPGAPRFGALPDRPLERPVVADVARTRSRTGWYPRIDLEEGLRVTVEAYRRARA